MADQRPPQQISGSALREQLLAAARKQAAVITSVQQAVAQLYQQPASGLAAPVPPAAPSPPR